MNYVREYYSEIESKKIVACEEIICLYKRMVEEMDRQEDASFPFYFDENVGKHAIEFIETFCKHYQGEHAGEVVRLELFQKAFSGNPALSYTASYNTPFGHVTYIVFQNKVVQFFNDQMNDINGNKNTLLQDIAPEVFGTEHAVYYCTEAPVKLSKPLGEWP